MSSEQNSTPYEKSPRSKRSLWWTLVLLILLVLSFVLQKCLNDQAQITFPQSSQSTPNTGVDTNSNVPLEQNNSSSTKTNSSQSISSPSSVAPSKTIALSQKTQMSSSVVVVPSKTDSLPPELEVSPPSGRFVDQVTLQASCNENKCSLYFSLGDSAHFKPFNKSTTLTQSGTYFVKATDSAQNSSYKILEYKIIARTSLCPKGMTLVGEGNSAYCIDEYEWPNQKGNKTTAYISWQSATDSCASQSKRLCSLSEWQQACAGPNHQKYPYGKEYNGSSCISNSNQSERSGKKDNCRSWDGAYDMAGNLWEWTSTPAQKQGFYMVAGGNWSSADNASCKEVKYSFFPQNQYPMVGFRCCSGQKK